MDDDEVIRETRVRYLHHDNYRDSNGVLKPEEVSIQNNGKIQGSQTGNKLTLASKDSDTIVMETLENNVAKTLRLLNLNLKKITPNLFNSYKSVERLEVGCPISVTWMFKHLPYMLNLRKVRFGRQAMCYEMNELNEDISSKIRPSPSVQLLEVSYDVEEYKNLSEDKRLRINSKIKLVLSLAPNNFPQLSECHLTLPKNNEVDLDNFLNYFPGLRTNGEKRAKYSLGYVQFISTKVPRRLSTSSDKQNRRRLHSNPTDIKSEEVASKVRRNRGDSFDSNPKSKPQGPQSPPSQSQSQSNKSQGSLPSYSSFSSNSKTDSDGGTANPSSREQKSRHENNYESRNQNQHQCQNQFSDPRQRHYPVRKSFDDDVICLADDSPSSSGIPADINHLPQMPSTIISGGGGGVEIIGGYSSIDYGHYGQGPGPSYSNSIKVQTFLNSNSTQNHVPRGPNSSGSCSGSDLSRGSHSRSEVSGSETSSLQSSIRRSESPEYIRPSRHRRHK